MNRASHRWFVILCCVVTSVSCLAGQELAKLTAADRAGGDYFGLSVSVSGGRAIIGAPDDDDLGAESGSAYIFSTADGTIWTQEQKLTPSDGGELQHFGGAVAIDGSYAVVGAKFDDDRGATSGSAYVFYYDGSQWTQQAKLTASDGAAGDNLGWSVAISGERVILGAPGDGDAGFFSGSAYIFKRDGITWSQEQKLTAADGAMNDYFGWSVAIDGNYAVVGAPEDDDLGTSSGSAYPFFYNGTAWVSQSKLLAADGSENARLGMSVAVNGSRIVAGAPQDSGVAFYSGAAYVFTSSGGSWLQSGKLTAADGGGGDGLGIAVSIRGDLVMVGTNADRSAYVFMREGSAWVQLTKLTDPSGSAEDLFGYSVSLGDDYAIVGAYGDDSGAGSAFVYDRISLLIAPVYRFWSQSLGRHFYTISKSERDKLLYNYSNTWYYESIAYYAFPKPSVPGILPIYRFWSGRYKSHFYTMKVSERDKLINNYSYVWTYEGPVFYAFPEESRPDDAIPVYRFWSSSLGTHFFTASATEKDKLINLYPHIWQYEMIAWYVYSPQSP